MADNEWKSLTDREWVNIVNSDAVKNEGADVHGAVCVAFKLIEAKLREKNEQAAHAQTPAKCLICGGSGWIGGPTFYEPGEGGEACPDCADINERIRRLFVEHGHLYPKWLELGRSILALANPDRKN